MKLNNADSQMLNILRQNKAAWLAYCDKAIAEMSDVTKLSKENFEGAKMAVEAVREFFVKPVKLSEAVEPGQKVGNEAEDFG